MLKIVILLTFKPMAEILKMKYKILNCIGNKLLKFEIDPNWLLHLTADQMPSRLSLCLSSSKLPKNKIKAENKLKQKTRNKYAIKCTWDSLVHEIGLGHRH